MVKTFGETGRDYHSEWADAKREALRMRGLFRINNDKLKKIAKEADLVTEILSLPFGVEYWVDEKTHKALKALRAILHPSDFLAAVEEMKDVMVDSGWRLVRSSDGAGEEAEEVEQESAVDREVAGQKWVTFRVPK